MHSHAEHGNEHVHGSGAYFTDRVGRKHTITTPWVMGVINRSPNSFYQPAASVQAAVDQAKQMIANGARIVDIGGEATNPFVNIEREAPSIQQEIDRVIPAIAHIKQHLESTDLPEPVLISVDTSTPAVMHAAVEAGADLINDQRALQREGALQTVAALKVPVCLMHSFAMARTPGDSSKSELLKRILSDLEARVLACLEAGIDAERLIIDPGFGGGNYGKNSAENFYLLAHLKRFLALKKPILVGLSRKSFIGEAIGVAPDAFNERLHGSVAGALLSAQQGAHIIRTHDVLPTVQALQVMQATQQQLSM